MRISIFGLGYVGAVSAGCLAERGHTVVGVDISEAKVRQLASGQSPILEAGLEEILSRHARTGRLSATTNAAAAIASTDLSLVCVGTPSAADGSPDASAVIRVCQEIGRSIAAKPARHVVAIRSTTLPRLAADVILPTLERESGKLAGEGFGFAVHPEFLREGTAVNDFFNPPKTVIGTDDSITAELIASLYSDIAAPLLITRPDVAMMVKFADNAFHALKVAFANEIGRVSKKWGIDAQEVMELSCKDTKLNISKAYLRPAFAFGGSCLPKDVRALVREGERSGASLPLLGEILRSNDAHILEVVELVRKAGARRVGIFGLTFKTGTDDLRESAAVRVARRLVDDGCDVLAHDPRVSVEKLTGANKQFADHEIPSLAQMMRYSAEEVMEAEVIVVVDADFDWAWAAARARDGQTLIDVEGGGKKIMRGDPRYLGLCW